MIQGSYIIGNKSLKDPKSMFIMDHKFFLEEFLLFPNECYAVLYYVIQKKSLTHQNKQKLSKLNFFLFTQLVIHNLAAKQLIFADFFIC